MGAIANLLAFPRANMRTALGAAVKRHRLPESLRQALVREAANFPDVIADAGWADSVCRDDPGGRVGRILDGRRG